MADNSRIKCRVRSYTMLRFWLDIEYRAFGWKNAGGEEVTEFLGYDPEYDSSGYVKRYRAKYSTTRYAYYVRPADYPTTITFALISFLNGLVSRIRVFLTSILPLAFIGLIVLTSIGGGELEGIELAVIGIYCCTYPLSILLTIIGAILRFVFRLDHIMDERDRANGYKPWSQY